MDNYNIASVLHEVAGSQKEATALVVPRRGGYSQYSFRDLDSNSRDFAGGLAATGIGPGVRVMLMVPPSMEFICLSFGLFALGAVVILIDPGMGYRNLLRCIGSVRPDFLISVPKGIIFSRCFPAPFKTLRRRICVGPSFGVLGTTLHALVGRGPVKQPFAAKENDLAAIIFTTGSTGPPKGVQYTHGIFHAQLRLIRDFYTIGPGEVDQPAFPLFALFSTALGARAVLPVMNPSRPAKVNPEKFVRTLFDQKVTYSFGSPAIWEVVSRYCLKRNIVLPVRKILMAGAPVSGDLVGRVRAIMPEDAEIHTPYGATESLPVTSISGKEILQECWSLTRQGKGVCVGRPLPEITISIIRPVDGPIGSWQEVKALPEGEIGEIVVKGPVVTRCYDQNEQETKLAKIRDNTSFRHRMGDMGYLDDRGRLWFCGRKAHVVRTAAGPLYTICCEGIFNTHPEVRRSALVGTGKPGCQQPVLLVEKEAGVDEQLLLEELLEIAGKHELTQNITTFFVHPGFPVDIRHNAKIFREKLSHWVESRMRGGSCLDGL